MSKFLSKLFSMVMSRCTSSSVRHVSGRGGVSRSEIDSKTMESKICEGLFFAGEVMDVDGPCG